MHVEFYSAVPTARSKDASPVAGSPDSGCQILCVSDQVSEFSSDPKWIRLSLIWYRSYNTILRIRLAS